MEGDPVAAVTTAIFESSHSRDEYGRRQMVFFADASVKRPPGEIQPYLGGLAIAFYSPWVLQSLDILAGKLISATACAFESRREETETLG